MRTTVARAFAGMALAIGLPLAAAGVAAAQTGPTGPEEPTGPTGPEAPPTSPTTTPIAAPGPGGLARTGGDAALPLAASAAAISIVLGGRRLAARLQA